MKTNKIFAAIFILTIAFLPSLFAGAGTNRSGGNEKGKPQAGLKEQGAQKRQELTKQPTIAALPLPASDSCDRIFLRDGRELLVKISRTNTQTIFYRHCSPDSNAEKMFVMSEVVLVRFGNGTTLVPENRVTTAAPAPVKKNEICSLLSFIFMLATLVGVALVPFGFLLPIAGLVLAIVGLARHKKYPGRFRNNKWMAKLAIALFAVFIFLIVLLIIAISRISFPIG